MTLKLELPSVASTVIEADGRYEDGVVHVRLAGTADYEARSDVDAVIGKLHQEMLRLRAPKVVVDLRALEFMNSSCFKVFVSWLAAVRDLEPGRQYRIHLRSNPALHWQRRSLAALACFAVDVVAIETE